MDQSRITPLGTNQTSNTGNHAMHQNTAGRAAANSARNAAAGTPGVQNSGQYGVVRAATNLALGDVIRGEISDLSGGEITITLENNTMIRGQISDNSMLFIGQTAAFLLDSITPQGVLIKPVGNYTETELTLINKALEEANLPATEHNQSAVKALMDNMMPISRESIQQLMQQAYDNKTTDMNTLALMNKLMMKVTPDSIATFSHYRNGTDMLAQQLQNYSTEIPSLLNALSEHGSADAVAQFAETLMQITMTGEQTDTIRLLTTGALSMEEQIGLQNLLSGTAMTEETMQALENGTLPLRDALTMIRDAAIDGTLSQNDDAQNSNLVEKLILIEQTLEPAGGQTTQQMQDSFHNILTLQNSAPNGDGETAENIGSQSPTPSEAETTHVENADTAQNQVQNGNGSALQLAGKLFHSFQETVNHSLNNTMQMLRNTGESVPEPNITATKPDLIDTLCDLYRTDASAHDLTGNLLSADARKELAGFLRQLPVSSALVNRLIAGEATTQEVMQVIRNVLPLSDSSILQSMFQSESFEQLFSRFLQTNWSLTPEQLQQEGQPDKLYNQLANQMNSLERLIGNSLSGSDSEQMQQQAHDIASNIALMKELSETFTYMQLPLKLPNQDTNSELYIYTQKNQRRMNPDKMSVLLHLDMAHLGTVEIRLDKNKQEIQANFRLQEEASIDLLRTNADILRDNLTGLGYQTNIVVSKQAEAPVNMDDFLNTKIKTNATEDMKRFSFDIRA
ncbi:MAG: flagellar hook-length control protein FliK [Eubacteriales bacterium]|nr:flagellar hook-length control protein FliK [Eubacteriales bacterium]